MSGVFTRGRMRIYLLKLLGEQPRHGYELLQLLGERFGGTYTPSPGSVYPRLRRLESDGLIEHFDQGGRKVYRLTDRGRAEVADRADELAQLEADIRSVSVLADDIGDEVRSSVRGVGDELAGAARDDADRRRRRWPGAGALRDPEWPEAVEFTRSGGMIDAQLHVLVTQVRQLIGHNPPSSEQIGACAAILDEAFRRLSDVLNDPSGQDSAR